MRASKIALGVAGLALLGFAAVGFAGRASNEEIVDFGTAVTPTTPTYRALLSPASQATVKEFRIPIVNATVEVAQGVTYKGWTFGGTVPGPVVRVREGDLVRIRLVNKASMPHSIDFHAARIPMNRAFRTIVPGDSLSFEFTARDPGAYLVHCGTPPVLLHLMQGMYLPIIVDPRDGWPTRVDKEFVVVQSEFYLGAGNNAQPGEPDWNQALAKQATYVVFNGRAFQYQAHPLEVAVGDRVRFFVVNAGPSFGSDFHIVGTVFDKVYPDGDPDHALTGVQTWSVPAGGGAVFETSFDEDASGEGMYAFVTHAFADAAKGAVGFVQVGTPKLTATAGH
ncbi:MAG TPA: multicopper oxidase domain-containing protein [Gemmatimonadales bacterium]|jgi:nitrite reductase (NO-forming)|nr:multicopper oxidase domain-containing protein [Gemmatimonadales bacterium]